MNENSLIVICGPTGIGKSALSIRLCKKINGAVISADSMQVYKGLDIGTAKIKEDEKDGILHFMIDVAEPLDTQMPLDDKKCSIVSLLIPLTVTLIIWQALFFGLLTLTPSIFSRPVIMYSFSSCI